MNNLDDPSRVERFREILPSAYIAAVLMRQAESKQGKPTPFEVGRICREITAMEYDKSPAYRIAMAYPIAAEVVSVERKTTEFDVDYFLITYRELADKDGEVHEIKTPLLNDSRFGKATKTIWDRFENGVSAWTGAKMRLYKHNEEPKPGDKSKNGFKRCVYAEPLS